MADKLAYFNLNETSFDMDEFTIIRNISAQIVDMRDDAIVEACIDFAKQAGIHDLILLDKKFVLDALREKIQGKTIDAVQVITNGQDTTYLRVKSIDDLRSRLIIEEDAGNRCAVYYEDTDDAVPVVHAEWRYTIRPMPSRATYTGLLNCPKCNGVFERLTGRKIFSYCPNCGAKMDGGPHDA